MEKVLSIVGLGAKAFLFAFMISMVIANTQIYERMENTIRKTMENKESTVVVAEAPVKSDIVSETTVLYDIMSQDGSIEINLNGTEITKKTILGAKSFFKNIKENDLTELLQNGGYLPIGDYERSYELDSSGNLARINYKFL